MSTDLMKMGNQLPADLKELMAQDVAKDLSRLGGLGGKDSIRITQNKKFVFPDETTSDGPLDLVIVDYVYRNEYYPQPFRPNEIVPPTCFAVNEAQKALTPSPNSPAVQHPTCDGCKWDVFGSHPSGRGKACKNTIYMAVLPPDATEETPLWVIKTSPTAIQSFNAYVTKVGNLAKVSLYGIVTRVFFDAGSTYATLRFDPVGPNPILELTMSRRAEARQRLLREPDFSGLTDD